MKIKKVSFIDPEYKEEFIQSGITFENSEDNTVTASFPEGTVKRNGVYLLPDYLEVIVYKNSDGTNALFRGNGHAAERLFYICISGKR